MKNQSDIISFIKGLFPPECRPLVWLTGGVVRDMLLHKPARDIDLAAALPPERLASVGFRPVSGRTTPDIWFLHDNDFGIIEVTLLENAGQLGDDLARRDFTINAMAMTLAAETVDPMNGARDLHERVLQVCSPSSFRDDPLRIFRAFRFASEEWHMATDTEKLIRQQDWEDLLAIIPVERFSREMLKALSGTFPDLFFRQMIEFHVGRRWLPELFCMPQIPAGPVEFHPEGDLLTHSLQVLEKVAAMTDAPLPRFCALFHDIGKLSTDPATYPKHHSHEVAGFRSAPLLARRLALKAEYGRALAWVSRLHGNLNRLDELRDSTGIKVAEKAVKAGIKDLLPLIAVADSPGVFCIEQWELLIGVATMTAAELGIGQEKLTGIPPEERGAFLLQKRVEKLRSSARQEGSV